jgi:uncharacterized membrane protein
MTTKTHRGVQGGQFGACLVSVMLAAAIMPMLLIVTHPTRSHEEDNDDQTVEVKNDRYTARDANARGDEMSQLASGGSMASQARSIAAAQVAWLR